jgi:hypothetical protein
MGEKEAFSLEPSVFSQKLAIIRGWLMAVGCRL